MATLSFVDRSKELVQFQRFVCTDQGHAPRVALYHTPSASGMTRFLIQAKGTLSEQDIVFAIDAQNQVSNSVFTQILLGIYASYPDLWRNFAELIEERSGTTKGKEIICAILNCISYIGPALGKAVEIDMSRSNIALSEYPSAVAELLCNFLVQVSKDARITILVDNAQDIDAWSMDLLRTTGGDAYSAIRYVLAFVDRGERRLDPHRTENQFGALGYVTRNIGFGRPDEGFIAALAHEWRVSLSASEVDWLVSHTAGDIYSILRTLREKYGAPLPDEGLPDQALSPLEEHILALLVVAKQSLRLSDMFALCARSPDIFHQDVSEVGDAVARLLGAQILSETPLPLGDSLLSVRANSIPVIHRIRKDAAKRILVSDTLYDFFSRVMSSPGDARHSPAETAPLLYRLSKAVDHDSIPARAQDLVRISVQMGSHEGAENYIVEAIDSGSDTGFEDFILQVACHCSMRSYRKALGMLDAPPVAAWKARPAARIFQAVALNRCRRYEEAESLIDELLHGVLTPEEICVLASFKLVGRLHQNNVEGARQVYTQHVHGLESAHNIGYFLRNAASAFPDMDGERLLDKALGTFDPKTDAFGYYTTLCNLGTRLCSRGSYAEAVQHLITARNALELYGIQHLHVVENDLGICLGYMNELDQAVYHLKRCKLVAQSGMPRFFCLVNLAWICALRGDASESIGILEDLDELVARTTIDRVRQKYFVNSATLRTWAGQKDLAAVFDMALAYPDRIYPERTERIVATLKESIEAHRALTQDDLRALFTPCYLVYWYPDPVGRLFLRTLSSDAEREDMSQ